MALTPEAVFRTLGERFQRDLLTVHSVPPSEEILSGNLSSLSRKTRKDLEHDLNCIATLSTDSASQIVHDYLSDAGWAAQDFAATRSTRERACALLCQYPEDFKTALAIWNGNRLRGKLDREQGFQLPDMTGFVFRPPDMDWHEQLKIEVSAVLARHYPSKVVSRVRLFERPGRGLATASETVLQCDVSMGEDPETIEVIENGEETTVTIMRLAMVSIIIDPRARSLFVGTSLQKKGLHKEIAETVAGKLLGIADRLDRLAPLRVYPERCKSPVRFQYSVNDSIETLRICGLNYRLYGTPTSLQFSVREESPGTSIHSHTAVQDHAKRMRIWRAVIEFEFKSKGDRPPLRRQVTLTEPSGISFGRAFPEERMIIEKVLVQSGLIDPAFNWKDAARFANIGRLTTPHHEAELSQSWQPLTLSNLRDAGILVQGQPHSRGWCRTCGATHEIGQRDTEDGEESYILCPHEASRLTPDHLDTLELSSEGLLKWLYAQAVSTRDPPAAIGPKDAAAWFLGRAQTSSLAKPFELILAYDVDLPITANGINEFLLHRHPKGPGLILTLSEDPIQTVFPNHWRTTPLSSVCEVAKSGLAFKKSAAAAIVLGKTPEKKQMTDEDWDAILLLFKHMYPGAETLQPYTVANAMISAEPELCNMTPRSIVSKLKQWAPDRFAP